MKELVFTTAITDHHKADNTVHNLFLIGIDCRRRQGQIPVTTITFGYKGVSSFVKVPADLLEDVINTEVLKKHGVISPDWNTSNKDNNLIQSVHYSFTSPDGCANISYFAKDRRTVTNIRVNMTDLIRDGFLDFDAIEGNFYKHIEQQ